MPYYDYSCEKCGHAFNQFQKIADRHVPEGQPCPECKEENCVTQQILGAPGFSDSMRMGIKKPPAGFREVLKEMDRKTPGSRLKQTSSYLD